MSWGDLSMTICESFWHDEGHSSHSTCGSCGGKGMRKHVEKVKQQQKENFAKAAAKWAKDNDWIDPTDLPNIHRDLS